MTTARAAADRDLLASLVARGGVVVLSGAGMSTASGIPDYRGSGGARRRRAQIRGPEFRRSPEARQRYWARSFLGYPLMAAARPNAAHHALVSLERRGLVDAVITQNVDGLHQAAGSRRVVELHGSVARVTCLNCGERTARRALQQRLSDANPGFAAQAATAAPDGDADLPAADVRAFTVVTCRRCGGDFAPDVVFFGDSVDRQVVARSRRLVDGASLLLVLGSSLAVMSGYRFVLQARRRGLDVAIVNRGPTRADGHPLAARVADDLAVVLPAVLTALGGQSAARVPA